MTHISIIQTNNSYESRAVSTLGILREISCIRCSCERLDDYKNDLLNGAIPVGSVEFLRKAMSLCGVIEPHPLGFPRELYPFLGRELFLGNKLNLKHGMFVKPYKTKLFTGFVYDYLMDEHDQEQFDVLKTMDDTEPLWISESIDIVAEFRFYIGQHGVILGNGRYDPGNEEVKTPNENFVKTVVNSLQIDHPYTIDVGVLVDGSSVVIELNDAWAIGLYKESISAMKYFSFLSSRWQMMERLPNILL